ncbi:MAG: ABC transporter permease [Anaerolineae bacterium]|nr:MAG: ABC transporter permease [Anaerolineae bacterium]
MGARLVELLRYRELLYNLVVRDLKVRYKKSVLGVAWSLLNPLFMMLVFTVVFTVMQPSKIERFPLFVLCALLPWDFFRGSVTRATGSIVGNAHLIKKVYFPREALPLSVVLSNLVNFLLALVVLFGMMVLLRGPFTAWLLYLPLLIVTQIIFSVGIALILCTINVFYRDMQHIMEVLMLAWFFVTPVFWDHTILPETARFLGVLWPVRRLTFILNPMASLISAYRDILYFGRNIDFYFLSRTVVTASIFLVVGYWVFARYSKVFGEEV